MTDSLTGALACGERTSLSLPDCGHPLCGVQVVIFVKSVARAKELNKLLVECNFPSICIHSAQKQDERCVSLFWHTLHKLMVVG